MATAVTWPNCRHRCLCESKSPVVQILSPPSRKTEEFITEPIPLERAPSFIFNNQREVEHGRSDLRYWYRASASRVYCQATAVSAQLH